MHGFGISHYFGKVCRVILSLLESVHTDLFVLDLSVTYNYSVWLKYQSVFVKSVDTILFTFQLVVGGVVWKPGNTFRISLENPKPILLHATVKRQNLI